MGNFVRTVSNIYVSVQHIKSYMTYSHMKSLYAGYFALCNMQLVVLCYTERWTVTNYLSIVLSGIASGYAGYTGVYGPGQIEGPPSRGGTFI